MSDIAAWIQKHLNYQMNKKKFILTFRAFLAASASDLLSKLTKPTGYRTENRNGSKDQKNGVRVDKKKKAFILLRYVHNDRNTVHDLVSEVVLKLNCTLAENKNCFFNLY